MSYAIIRNIKYKSENLKLAYRHNERRNKNYSNQDIDMEKSYLNYSLKFPQYSYEKEFERIRKEYNLKGQIKVVSNIACEYIITSDDEAEKYQNERDKIIADNEGLHNKMSSMEIEYQNKSKALDLKFEDKKQKFVFSKTFFLSHYCNLSF